MSWYLNSVSIETWAYADNVFTAQECDSIIEIGKKTGLENGKLSDGSVDFEYRKSKILFFNSNNSSFNWIYQRVTDAVNIINKQFWNYDLSYIEDLQFTSYTEKDDFFTKHIDQISQGGNYRKLSFSIQLSSPNNYEGSDLLLHTSSNYLTTRKEKGTMIFFPSFVLHEVTPLISGERYSLVGWVCGPSFK